MGRKIIKCACRDDCSRHLLIVTDEDDLDSSARWAELVMMTDGGGKEVVELSIFLDEAGMTELRDRLDNRISQLK